MSARICASPARTMPRGRGRLIAFAFAATLGLPATALAIVGGSGADANSVDSPWAGVGSVVTGRGTFSGALIAPGYVLTAAHVLAGAAGNPAGVTFQINAGTSTQIAASQIYVNPSYTGIAATDGFVHNDLAIIRLAGAAPKGVPYYNLYGSALNGGERVSFVGYGHGGTGDTGANVPKDPAVKRTGQNQVDVLLPGALGNEVYLFDFDGPTTATNLLGPALPANLTLGANVEATLASGDSGSPAFVRDLDGKWKIAAMNTFLVGFGGPYPSLFGSGGGGMLIAAYAPWIQSVMMPMTYEAVVAPPIPEPATSLLMLLGLAGVGVLARRRHRG